MQPTVRKFLLPFFCKSWPAGLQLTIQETITGHILAPVLFFILKMRIALNFPGICLFVCLFWRVIFTVPQRNERGQKWHIALITT